MKLAFQLKQLSSKFLTTLPMLAFVRDLKHQFLFYFYVENSIFFSIYEQKVKLDESFV